jgi:hypothetical protein
MMLMRIGSVLIIDFFMREARFEVNDGCFSILLGNTLPIAKIIVVDDEIFRS